MRIVSKTLSRLVVAAEQKDRMVAIPSLMLRKFNGMGSARRCPSFHSSLCSGRVLESRPEPLDSKAFTVPIRRVRFRIAHTGQNRQGGLRRMGFLASPTSLQSVNSHSCGSEDIAAEIAVLALNAPCPYRCWIGKLLRHNKFASLV